MMGNSYKQRYSYSLVVRTSFRFCSTYEYCLNLRVCISMEVFSSQLFHNKSVALIVNRDIVYDFGNTAFLMSYDISSISADKSILPLLSSDKLHGSLIDANMVDNTIHAVPLSM